MKKDEKDTIRKKGCKNKKGGIKTSSCGSSIRNYEAVHDIWRPNKLKNFTWALLMFLKKDYFYFT